MKGQSGTPRGLGPSRGSGHVSVHLLQRISVMHRSKLLPPAISSVWSDSARRRPRRPTLARPAAGGGPADRCRGGRNGRDISRGRHPPRVAPVGGDVTGCVLPPEPPSRPFLGPGPPLGALPAGPPPARREAAGCGGPGRPAGCAWTLRCPVPRGPRPPVAPRRQSGPGGARRDVVVALGDKRGGRGTVRAAGADGTGPARAQGCRGSTRHPTRWCRPRWPSWSRRRRS